jgi:uncharacterized membrane protein
MTDVHASVDQLARLLELAGVAIIVGGVVVAALLFAYSGLTTRDWRPAYEECRSNLGRGILLGLELLVGADIISTILVVIIRTFLSFSLETEIEGCWPWQRAAKEARSGGAGQR